MDTIGLVVSSGAQITFVFKLKGTIKKPGKITAKWNNLTLSFEDEVEVDYKPNCSLGTFTTVLSPESVMGLNKNQFYSATYSIPYVDADGFIFEAENQTIDGITLSRERSVGSVAGNLVYKIEGVYTGESTNYIKFITNYGCSIYIGNYLNNCNELLQNSRLKNEVLPSGVYKIDPDGNGGIEPFDAYCDMETENGGWTLFLNYLHKESTNPELSVLTDKLPIQNGKTLGLDESGTSAWGHAGVNLASKLKFTEIRMYGITSAHKLKINFKTSLSNVISYIKTGKGSMVNLNSNFVALDGHTTTLPASATNYTSNYGDLALTYFPYWKAGVVIWSIRTPTGAGNPNRWEVEDYDYGIGTDTNSPSTHHQVWIT